MLYSSLLIVVLFIVTRSMSAPHQLPHDQIAKFPKSGGPLETQYQPALHIGNGCHSYPAVDVDGNWSGGLKPTGAPSAACKDTSKAQTYVRSATFQGKTALVYAWYMPKDEISTGIGHRHDWEGAVVFLNSDTQQIDGVAASAHGKWRKYPNPGGANIDDTHVKLQYSAEPVINSHALDLTDKGGDLPTLASWEGMGADARAAINERSHWGDANPPIADSLIDSSLSGAWMW
uniref:Necrosis-and ethylene-inducing protein 1 n=1 Tax=Moniliophthora perniciosa TaxID=153609 RepID=A5JEL9_MONPR|nr:necrosis- and ethylene-inducing protein 1 [Moniliophthora perniciosa]